MFTAAAHASNEGTAQARGEGTDRCSSEPMSSGADAARISARDSFSGLGDLSRRAEPNTRMPCEPDAFVVAFLSQEQWGDRVLLAHRVFAICIVAVMSAWMLLLLEVTSVPAAYALAGASTAGCGAWLVFWVFVWVDPTAGLAQLR